MVECEVVEPRWHGRRCVVAAPGPSLTSEVAEVCRAQRIIAVNDAWRRMPFAAVLFACDAKWWEYHKGCQTFAGERWSSHQPLCNDKLAVAEKYGIRLVRGATAHGFSFDPQVIHYGSNSGFQAINLALLFGANPIVLVGFDMHGGHFFGEHPRELNGSKDHSRFIPHFEKAAEILPESGRVVNATSGSVMKCFPSVTLEDALGEKVVA